MYDARMCIGRDHALAPFQAADLPSLRRALDTYRIEKAFLTSFMSFRLHPLPGNERTFEAAAADPRLIPAPTVLPNSAEEVGEEEDFVDDLVRRGARGVHFCPASLQVALDRRVIGRLFGCLQDRRLPVTIVKAEADLMQVAQLAEWYPRLPVLYAAVGHRERNLIPLLKALPNLHLVICPPFAANRGLEQLVRACGARQLLFGSSYPVSEPGATISYLFHSDLSPEAVEAISRANMARLVEEVSRG